jgi:hypothetical protein
MGGHFYFLTNNLTASYGMSWIGSKVEILSVAPGNPAISGGVTSTGTIVNSTLTNSIIYILGEDNTDSFPKLNRNSVGDVIRISVGMGGCVQSSTATKIVSGPSACCLMQEACGYLYILVATRSYLDTGIGKTWPSYIIKWNGTPNPGQDDITYFPLKLSGNDLECWGLDSYFDATNSTWHILTYDRVTQSVNHFAWDCVNDRQRSYGSIYTMTAASQFGLPSGLIVGHADNEQNAIITATQFDSLNQKMFISYKLYSTNNALANISVEYNDTINPWQSASRFGTEGDPLSSLTTSVSGDSHTFVHDTYYDMGFFDGTIQYRITPT